MAARPLNVWRVNAAFGAALAGTVAGGGPAGLAAGVTVYALSRVGRKSLREVFLGAAIAALSGFYGVHYTVSRDLAAGGRGALAEQGPFYAPVVHEVDRQVRKFVPF